MDKNVNLVLSELIDVTVVILSSCSVHVKWLYALFLLVLPLYELYLVH